MNCKNEYLRTSSKDIDKKNISLRKNGLNFIVEFVRDVWKLIGEQAKKIMKNVIKLKTKHGKLISFVTER